MVWSSVNNSFSTERRRSSWTWECGSGMDLHNKLSRWKPGASLPASMNTRVTWSHSFTDTSEHVTFTREIFVLARERQRTDQFCSAVGEVCREAVMWSHCAPPLQDTEIDESHCLQDSCYAKKIWHFKNRRNEAEFETIINLFSLSNQQ